MPTKRKMFTLRFSISEFSLKKFSYLLLKINTAIFNDEDSPVLQGSKLDDISYPSLQLHVPMWLIVSQWNVRVTHASSQPACKNLLLAIHNTLATFISLIQVMVMLAITWGWYSHKVKSIWELNPDLEGPF